MFTENRWAKIGVGAMAALALGLTGCSGGSDDASSEESTDGNIQLTFHSWLPTQVQWPELIEAFEAENPNIQIEFNREEDFDNYRMNLDNEILADDVPDLYGVQVGATFEDYADYALPAEEYASDWIGELNDAAVEQTTTADGTIAAVPILTAGMEYYLYNKTLMDELGLELPGNYEELKKVSQEARDQGYSPFAMGAADTWHNADFFVWLSNQFGEGGEIYKAAAGDIDWDSPALIEAGEAWAKLFEDGIFQDAATTITTYPAARDDFLLQRRAIAMPTGSWHVGMALVEPDKEQPGTKVENDEIGMAVFPQIGPNDAGVTSGVDFAIAISDASSPEKQEAAAKFVEFMAVGTGQQLWVNTLQGFPVAQDIEVQVADEEPELGKESVDLVTNSLAEAKYSRKLLSTSNASLENDLGIVLQNIAAGADVASELATLNK